MIGVCDEARFAGDCSVGRRARPNPFLLPLGRSLVATDEAPQGESRRLVVALIRRFEHGPATDAGQLIGAGAGIPGHVVMIGRVLFVRRDTVLDRAVEIIGAGPVNCRCV